MIEECEIKELNQKLGLSIDFQSSAVTMADQKSGLLVRINVFTILFAIILSIDMF